MELKQYLMNKMKRQSDQSLPEVKPVLSSTQQRQQQQSQGTDLHKFAYESYSNQIMQQYNKRHEAVQQPSEAEKSESRKTPTVTTTKTRVISRPMVVATLSGPQTIGTPELSPHHPPSSTNISPLRPAGMLSYVSRKSSRVSSKLLADKKNVGVGTVTITEKQHYHQATPLNQSLIMPTAKQAIRSKEFFFNETAPDSLQTSVTGDLRGSQKLDAQRKAALEAFQSHQFGREYKNRSVAKKTSKYFEQYQPGEMSLVSGQYSRQNFIQPNLQNKVSKSPLPYASGAIKGNQTYVSWQTSSYAQDNTDESKLRKSGMRMAVSSSLGQQWESSEVYKSQQIKDDRIPRIKQVLVSGNQSVQVGGRLNGARKHSNHQMKSLENVKKTLARNNYGAGRKSSINDSHQFMMGHQTTEGHTDKMSTNFISPQKSPLERSYINLATQNTGRQEQTEQKPRLLRDFLKQPRGDNKTTMHQIDHKLANSLNMSKQGLISVIDSISKTSMKGQRRQISQKAHHNMISQNSGSSDSRPDYLAEEHFHLTNDLLHHPVEEKSYLSYYAAHNVNEMRGETHQNRLQNYQINDQDPQLTQYERPLRTAVDSNKKNTKVNHSHQGRKLVHNQTTSAHKVKTPFRKMNEAVKPRPEVYQGIFELSKYEHRLQNKLHSHLKNRPAQINLPDRSGGKQSDTASRLSTQLDNPQRHRFHDSQDSVGEPTTKSNEQRVYIQKELKRLKRGTINLNTTNKKLLSGTVDSSTFTEGESKKVSPFFNPKYFDQRFDQMGNFLPAFKDESPKIQKHADSSASLTQEKKSQHQQAQEKNQEHKRHSRSTLNIKVQHQSRRTLKDQHSSMNSRERKSNASIEQTMIEMSHESISRAQSREDNRSMQSIESIVTKKSTEKLNPDLADLLQQKHSQMRRNNSVKEKAMLKQERIAKKKDAERELLFEWVDPEIRKKPISNKAIVILDKFLNPTKRHETKKQKDKETMNVRFWSQAAEQNVLSQISMQKREKRIFKAERNEARRKMQEEKGLIKVKVDNDSQLSESEYQSSNTDSKSSDSEKQVEKLDEIFAMDEAQLVARLAEEVAYGGQTDEQLLEMNNAPTEMTEKQRMRCFLMVQLFFADLGDAQAITLKDQTTIATQVKNQYELDKRKAIKEEQVRVKREKAERKAQRMKDNPDFSVNTSETSSDQEDKKSEEDDDNSDVEDVDEEAEEGQDEDQKKQKKKKVSIQEKITVNTNTIVQTDSKKKRDKLDEAVRKILLFKDMKASDTKGDMDPAVKLNQVFIQDTIAQYSGSITAPTNINKRALKLTGYYLNEGVCQSLGKYFASLTFNHLQILQLSANGLKDASMAVILQGLNEQRALRRLSYGENEMGPLTAEIISQILFWPNPTNLEYLKLTNLKTTSYNMAIVLSALRNNRKLVYFDIEKIPLTNSKNFDYLYQFLKANKNLKNLRLSYTYFLPHQVIELMQIVKRRKNIQFLDLSHNNLAPEPRSKALVKQFVNLMRRFILRTQIFHLDLSGMSLGKTVGKLVQAINASSTLNCVHLSQNSVPLEIVYFMDRQLAIPETRGNKVNKFRPISEVKPESTEQTLQTKREDESYNYGNVNTQGSDYLKTFDSARQKMTPEQLSEQQQTSLKQDLIDELQRRKEAKVAEKEQGKRKRVAELVTPVTQMPLIYNRITNHPEFIFPTYFMAKGNKQSNIQYLIEAKIKNMLNQNAAQAERQNKTLMIEERQDTVYFSHDATHQWGKIEALTQQQIKKGKKGVQPDFRGIMGREGIVNTNHETCWVCEKRKYVLLSVNMDPTASKPTWGTPITDPREKQKLCKKYLPNRQMPGVLNENPILISSINDWFPIHMVPVVNFAMLLDYNLMQDLARGYAEHLETQDSVAKFQEGYKQIIQHISNIKKLDSSVSTSLYKDMWRTQILKNLIYPHDTLFIDFPPPTEEIEPDFLYMFAGLVKPGKHRSLLYDPETDIWFKRDFFVDEREMDVPEFAQYENITADKGPVLNSILKEWKADTAATYRRCMEHDESCWKIFSGQFIKDQGDIDALRILIVKYYDILKEIFILVAAKNDFPHIGMFGAEEFSNQAGLTDKVVVKKDVNRMFITANFSEDSKESAASANALNRNEFIEFLVRMAKFKYKDAVAPNGVQTCSQAFELLINQQLIPYHEQSCNDGQPFREKFLHNTVIDHLMHANKRSLEQIFVKLASQNKNRTFTPNNAFQMDKALKLQLLDSSISYCYGMCQQTVEAETKKQGQYARINFIEFIEFLCRLLYCKFSTDQDSNLLKPGAGQTGTSDLKDKESKMPAVSQSFATSGQTTNRKGGGGKTQEQNAEEQKEAHNRHLFAFKDFICATLQPYFEAQALEFIDPDEDVVLSDSDESEFVYDLPSGYNSNDENNPDHISVLSSGNESSESHESEDFQKPLLDISMLSLPMQDQGNPNRPLSGNRLGDKSYQQSSKIRKASARKRMQQILKGDVDEDE